MPLSTVARLAVERLEMLDAEGRLDASLPYLLEDETLLDMYRKMTAIRAFDEKAFKLQRQGRLGTYPQILGQEATQIAPPLCLRKKDWLVPTYRGQGAYFARGMQLRNNLLYWGGDDRGARFSEGCNDFMFAIPVGSHMTQAAGLAWAAKITGDDSVVLCYLGDGASSKGDFHEALTFAGVHKLALLFLIENNQYAISVPRALQCAAETFAQKASGYGAFGLQVDGNDAVAVYHAVRQAVERGRSGEGPSVLECVTYRLGHHTTADDASRYRSEAEVETWRKRDPVARLRKFLFSRGLLDEAGDAALLKEAEAMVQEEIAAYEAYAAPNPLDMFAHNYAVAPRHLIEQRAELEALLRDGRSDLETVELPPAEGRFP